MQIGPCHDGLQRDSHKESGRAYNPSFKPKTNYHPYYANTGLYLNIFNHQLNL